MGERRVDCFFYGLFVEEERLRAVGITPVSARRARLDDYRILIGDRATLVRDPGAHVLGMLFSLTPTELDRLYRGPGLEQYRPEPVLTRTPGGEPVPALCYTLPEPPSPTGHNADYAARLRAALRRLGFPESYIESIG